MLLDVGLAIFIFLFPFSPKIPVNLFNQNLQIRLDDVIVPVLFFIWLIEWLTKKRQLIYSKLYIPVGAYFLIGVISTLLGYFVKHTIQNPLYTTCIILRSAEYYIIFFLTVNILKTKKQLMNYLNVWMIATIVISLYGIFDRALNISGPTGLYDKGWFLWQSNHMGGYLMISLIVAIGLYLRKGQRAQRILPLIAIPFISYALFFTLSRTTYISAIVAIFVYCMLKSKQLVLLPIILAFFLFWFMPVMMPNTLVGQYLDSVVKDTLSLRTDMRTTESRVASDFSAVHHRRLMTKAFKRFLKYPVTGEGFGARQLKEYDSQIALVPAATGITGSLAFIWLFLSIFITGIKAYRKGERDSDFREVARIFLSIFAGALIHSIASVAFVIAVIAYSFWLLAGMLIISTTEYNNVVNAS